jgi:hypothetical protein
VDKFNKSGILELIPRITSNEPPLTPEDNNLLKAVYNKTFGILEVKCTGLGLSGYRDMEDISTGIPFGFTVAEFKLIVHERYMYVSSIHPEEHAKFCQDILLLMVDVATEYGIME